jgi:hypothetical protein
MAETYGSSRPNALSAARRILVGGVGKTELLHRLLSAGVQMNDAARDLFADERFQTAAVGTLVEVVEATVASLGFDGGATFGELAGEAARRRLALCPLELGPHFRLQYLDQPEGSAGRPPSRHRAPPGSITVASAPIADDHAVPKGFYLRRIEGIPWLRGYRSSPDHVYRPEDVFAFARPDA